MKQNFKTFSKTGFYLFFLVALLFISCEKDIYNESIEQRHEKLNFTWSKKTISELNQKEKFQKGFTPFITKQKQELNKAGKTAMENMYNFTIDSSQVHEVIAPKYTSYTFGILRPYETPNYYENLFIEIDSTDAPQATILKYNINPLTNTVTSITYKPVQYNTNQVANRISYMTNCNTISITTETQCPCLGHWPGEYCECEIGPSSSTSYHQVCEEGGGENDYDTNNGGSFPIRRFINGVPITVTYVMPAAQVRKKEFQMVTLNQQEIQWLSNQNEDAQKDIYDYLEYGEGLPYDDVKKDFVRIFINNCITNSTLNIDFNLSLKSPAFIDMSSVNGNTPEEVKFREVYNSLTQSPLFKELFINMFGVSPLFNVKFTIANIPTTPLGQPSGLCKLYVSPNNPAPYNIIEIDRNFILTKSKIDLAKTILHECIHAFLNIKLRNPSVGMTIQSINNLDFQSCVNTFYNGFSGGQTQHSFFVHNMIPTMVNVLTEIKDLLVTPEQENQLQYPTGLVRLYSPVLGSTPLIRSTNQIPWNWNDFFYYFCHNGLQNCEAYPFMPNLLNIANYYNFYYIIAFDNVFNP